MPALGEVIFLLVLKRLTVILSFLCRCAPSLVRHSQIPVVNPPQQPVQDILDSNDLLPSLDEIERTGCLLSRQGNTRILVLPNDDVVKYGPAVRMEEARTLKFLNQYPDIRAPRLRGVRIQSGRVLDKDGDTGEEALQTCIYMTRIPGDPLSTLLPAMDRSTMSCIAHEIRNEIDKLRSLKSEGYVGSVGRGVCLDPLFRPGKSHGYGPFESEEAMNEFLVSDRLPRNSTLKCYARKFMNSKQHTIYFTHGDLVPRNILVEDGHLSGIVDWQTAGWYPDYWEFVRACMYRSDDDWHKHIETVGLADYSYLFLYLVLRQ
jgi:hypothetical protein